MPKGEHLPDEIEPPPFLKTWRSVYVMVLGYLAILLLILILVTRAYRY